MKDVIKYIGINALLNTIKAKLTNSNLLITVKRPDIRFPFYLRCLTSDIPTFKQIFVKQQYDFIVEECPQVIVDAGANIGLSAIYFANKYPEAKIIAIEPEASNYELLKKNIAPYSNIIPLNVALWDKNEEISLVDPGLGKWGFMTQRKYSQEEHSCKMCHKVQGMTIDKIMENCGLERINILKVDIEGAEREVFIDSSSWIKKIDALIIELHERMKAGCNRSVYGGLNGFDEVWEHGENVYFSRRKYLKKSCN